METYVKLCTAYRVPLWVAPLLKAASRLKSDEARRRKVYRLVYRTLLNHQLGCSKVKKPTYIYPDELKQLIRSAFPEHVCNYVDPHHENAVFVTLEDLNAISSDSSCKN